MSKPIEIKKEKYDYYTSRNGEKIVTVCYILTEDGTVGRGISIWNGKDEYNETIGQNYSQQYALRAIKWRHIDPIRRPEIINRLIQCKCPFTKKGEHNPQLSYWEMRLLFGKKNFIEEYEESKIKSFAKGGRGFIPVCYSLDRSDFLACVSPNIEVKVDGRRI